MPSRSLVSFAAVCSLGLERFACYALRGQVAPLFEQRGLELAAAIALRASMDRAATLLTVLFALVAVVVPRAAVAVLGLLMASTGIIWCTFGEASTFEKGMWLALAGSGVFKAVSLAMCAEFVASPRLKVGLPVVAYAVLNLGSMLGVVLGDAGGALRAALIGYGLGSVVAIASSIWLFVKRSEPAPPVTTSPMNAVSVALMALPAACALWVEFDVLFSAPVVAEGPLWLNPLNSAVMGALALGIALVVVISPARWLSKLTLSSMLLGAGAVTAVVVATLLGRPQSLGEGIGLLLVGAVAEAALVAVAMGTCLALVPVRLAPLAVAGFSLAGIATNGVSSLPPVLVQLSGVSLALLGLSSLVLLVLLRKQLLAPLDVQGPSGAVSASDSRSL